MPKKIPFRVVYCTGYEDNFPPKDLEVHSPFIKGWRSPRYCLYPQEIVIRSEHPVRFRKIQLLSHQYLIPTKIELYVGQTHPHTSHMSLDHTHFTRLGYISLSDNEQTGFRSRELKSVNVDCTGQLIKLVLLQNHINRFNLFNQVGLVALNVIADHPHGEEVGVAQSLPSHVTHYVGNQNKQSLSRVQTHLPSYQQSPVTDPVLLGTINKSSRISAMDDLAFAIAQDPQTAAMIRKLDARKTLAVKEEKFDFAKHLKQVIDELQKIGEFLCRYEIEKKSAIDREDYDTAKEKKSQADQIRKQVFDKLDVQALLQGGNLHQHQPSKRKRNQYHANERGHPIVKKSPFENASMTAIPPPDPPTDLSPGRRPSPILPPLVPNPSATPPPTTRQQQQQQQDDRPLPALMNKANQEQSLSGQREEEDVEREEMDEKPEHLTGKQLNEVPIAIEVFGMEKVELVYAKQYPLRERGIQQVRQVMDSMEDVSRKEIATLVKATCQILKKALRDKVHSLFTQSLELLKYFVGPYTQQHRLTKPELTFIIEKIFPTLLSRTGDMSPRIHTAAMNTVMELAQHNQIKQLSVVGPLLVEPFKQQNVPWRLAKSRIEILERFIHDPGLNSSGVTTRKLMEFVSLCLQHSNGDVRDCSVKLTLDLYRIYGQEIRQLLPVVDDGASRKKTLWKTVFEGFDLIDGVPTLKEREAAKANQQKAKNEEIQKLQEQVNMLRSLASKGETVTEDKLEGILHANSSQKQNEGSPPDDSALDMTCVFCSEQRSDLVGSGMEAHYLNECPMLQTCTHCSQVVEISGLTKHWLMECEAKDKFTECSRCNEAIHSNSYEGHMKASSCRPAVKENGGNTSTSRCPLCHNDIQNGDDGWRSHLMGPGPHTCPRNRLRRGRKAGQAPGVRNKPAGRGIPRAVPKGGAVKRPVGKK